MIIGDWDGNGIDSPAVRRGRVFHLKNDFTGGQADHTFGFGLATDKAIVGRVHAPDPATRAPVPDAIGRFRPNAP